MRAKKAEAYITPVRKPPHRHTNMAISNHGNASSKRVCMGSSQTIVICTYSTLIFMYFVFCDYIIPRGLRFVKGKYTISTKKFEKMQTVCKEGRKKYRSGTFFNFMSLRGTAHKRTNRGPLMNLPDQRENPLDTPRSGDSPLRAQTYSSVHSADRTEEQRFRSTKGGT